MGSATRVAVILAVSAVSVLSLSGWSPGNSRHREIYVKPESRVGGARLVSLSLGSKATDAGNSAVFRDKTFLGTIGTEFWLKPGENLFLITYPNRAELTLSVELLGDSILLKEAKFSSDSCSVLRDEAGSNEELQTWLGGLHKALRTLARDEITVVPLPGQPAVSDVCADRLRQLRYERVTVSSVPPGAWVYVEGERIGSTTTRLELLEGVKTRIVLKKKGFISRGYVLDADDLKVTIELERIPASARTGVK